MGMRAGGRFGVNASALLAAMLAASGDLTPLPSGSKNRDPLPQSSHAKRSKKKRRK